MARRKGNSNPWKCWNCLGTKVNQRASCPKRKARAHGSQKQRDAVLCAWIHFGWAHHKWDLCRRLFWKKLCLTLHQSWLSPEEFCHLPATDTENYWGTDWKGKRLIPSWGRVGWGKWNSFRLPQFVHLFLLLMAQSYRVWVFLGKLALIVPPSNCDSHLCLIFSLGEGETFYSRSFPPHSKALFSLPACQNSHFFSLEDFGLCEQNYLFLLA